MTNNSDPPTGWNTDNTLGQTLTQRNNEQKESTEEEEVEVIESKSADELTMERMNKQGSIDLCSPLKALKNNNDTTIIDSTTATDDDEMKRLLSAISKVNPALEKKNKEIIIKVLKNNNDTTIIANTTAIDDDEMKSLLSVISKLNPVLEEKNLYLVLQDTATDDDEMKVLRSEISKLMTVLKKKNKTIQDTNKILEKAEAQAATTTIEIKRRLYTITAVAGIVLAVLLLATGGGMWWLFRYGKIQFSDEVTLRESCSE